MPDGSGPSEEAIAGAQSVNRRPPSRPRLSPWLFGSRTGLLTVFAAAAFVGLAGALVIDAFVRPFLETDLARDGLLLASLLLWAPLILMLLDPPDNMAQGPRLRLPAASIVILAGLAIWAAADPLLGAYLATESGSQNGLFKGRLTLFFGLLALAFLPLVWNASNFARFLRAQLEERQRHADKDGGDLAKMVQSARNTEAASALIATAAVLGIGGLAVWAGATLGPDGGEETGSSLNLSRTFGLALCASVAALFAAVVLMDHIQDWPVMARLARGLNGLSRPGIWIARFYGWIDAGLVFIGAGIVGMNHRTWVGRYLVLTAQLGCLAVMGWYLPAPLGLVPLGIAFLLAISVSRLWSWVEDDRSLAAMTSHNERAPYKVGFREDYRDETLLGFIFIFAIAPMAMMQMHTGVFGNDLFTVNGEAGFLDWMAFFGVELAKAVPIVDWAEIYGVNSDGLAIEMQTAPSRHAVFLARIMVDLVLIAALLQAFAISARNRNQKRLYADGNLDRLDSFVEKREMAKAIHRCRQPDGSFKLSYLRDPGLIDFRRYDAERLQVLYWTSNDAGLRGFIEELERGSPSFELRPAIVEAQELAERGAADTQIIKTFERALVAHDKARKLPVGAPGRAINLIDAETLRIILTTIGPRSGIRTFKEGLIRLVPEVATTPETAIDVLGDVAAGEARDSQALAKRLSAELILTLLQVASEPSVLIECRKKLEARVESESASIRPVFEQLIRALRKRIDELLRE